MGRYPLKLHTHTYIYINAFFLYIFLNVIFYTVKIDNINLTILILLLFNAVVIIIYSCKSFSFTTFTVRCWLLTICLYSYQIDIVFVMITGNCMCISLSLWPSHHRCGWTRSSYGQFSNDDSSVCWLFRWFLELQIYFWFIRTYWALLHNYVWFCFSFKIHYRWYTFRSSVKLLSAVIDSFHLVSI